MVFSLRSLSPVLPRLLRRPAACRTRIAIPLTLGSSRSAPPSRLSLFIGATVLDKRFHVYDKATGKLLYQDTLPLSANAKPATYEVDGRQYVVIACGGDRDPSTQMGGIYVAYALPK